MPEDDPETAQTGMPRSVVPADGVLIRAENGDVVTFDETGLTLRLSDRVLADLRQRLALPEAVPAHLIGDIDAWNLRKEGDWLRFTARIEAGRPPRDYCKPVTGGDIIADAIGPLQAIFSIGGARRAGFNDGPPGFAYHILAPGDHLGAVGHEGTDEAQPTGALQRLAHSPRDALSAGALLQMRYEAMQSLPLIVARTETDGAMSLDALNGGQAYVNFLSALDSLVLAASALGKRPQVLAVGIDLSLEDTQSDAASRIAALRRLMQQIEADMAARQLYRPIFLITAEAGTQSETHHPAILAHSELGWSHTPHRFAASAPGYMFEQTRFARPTNGARIRMAEMDAHAIAALSTRKDWFCPQILLAEHDGKRLRVTCRAMSGLVLEDRFNAGPACGFALLCDGKAPTITDVAIAPDDPQSLILTLSASLKTSAYLTYAYGAKGPSPDAFPANRGALRDGWSAASRAGDSLHRWALPALVPCHPGAL